MSWPLSLPFISALLLNQMSKTTWLRLQVWAHLLAGCPTTLVVVILPAVFKGEGILVCQWVKARKAEKKVGKIKSKGGIKKKASHNTKWEHGLEEKEANDGAHTTAFGAHCWLQRDSETLATITSPFRIPTTGCVNHQGQLKGAAVSNNCISSTQPHTGILNPQETSMSPYVASQQHFQWQL